MTWNGVAYSFNESPDPTSLFERVINFSVVTDGQGVAVLQGRIDFGQHGRCCNIFVNGYSLTQVPEPGSLALVMAGALGLGWQRRRARCARRAGVARSMRLSRGTAALCTWSNALESGVQGELVPVCRFYTTKFAPKSSHFYSAFAHECEATRGNSDWTFETDAFYAALPSATGQCTAGLRPVYRLCNNGGTGPPITSSRLR